MVARKGIIDRFEGQWAVLELDSGGMVNILRHLLPTWSREGDVVTENGQGGWRLDEAATRERRKRVEDAARDLFTD